MVVFSGGSLLGEPDRVAYFSFAESEGAMNEDIIRMAREAGWTDDLMGVSFVQPLLARFAELVRADEREACAELIPSQYYELRDRIRARGNE